MKKFLQKLTEKSMIRLNTVNGLSRAAIINGSLIGTVIASIPFLFYLYESVPSTATWDTFLFTYNSKGFEDANFAMWVVTGKIIPLLILFIWFFTCKHWWYHVIIVPITMYIFQITAFFHQDSGPVDEFQLIYMVPIMAIITPSIYLIRAQMLDKINSAGKTMEELEAEFMIKPKTLMGKLKQYF